MGFVLVLINCYNSIPQTMWPINKRNLFLTILEIEKSNVKMLKDLVSGENPHPGS